MPKRRIYLASSWRNPYYFDVLAKLRAAGHEVYDFRNPAPGNKGFAWRDCGGQAAEEGPGSGANTIPSYLEAIRSERATEGFRFDKNALDWCDTCVLALPCGRSAHLELGYAAGQGKDTFVLLHEDKFEPELMYLLNTGIYADVDALVSRLDEPTQRLDVVAWHQSHGGRFARPASHALRLLREVVELCAAAGASQDEVANTVGTEMGAQNIKGEFFGTYREVASRHEWIDCALLLELLGKYMGASLDSEEARLRFIEIRGRAYTPDAGGALFRTGRALRQQ